MMEGMIGTLQNELALVRRAIAEPAAFAALYDYYFPRVYNYIRYRIQDAQATDDLTAEVFERLLRNLGKYRSERAPFSAWVFAIARHAVSDYLRTQRYKGWLSLDFLHDQPAEAATPEDHAAEQDIQHRLLAALQELDERERDLIALKFTGGLTNRQIAAMTGLRESNVGVILYRATRKLKVMLTEEESHE